MWKRTKVFCLIVSVMIILSLFLSLPLSGEEGDKQDLALVYYDNLEELNPIQEDIIVEYESFVLIKADQNRLTNLEKLGYHIDYLHNRNNIHVKDWTFNIGNGELEIPFNLKGSGFEEGELGTYIVHFIGPIKAEWADSLKERGAKVLDYIPNYAYKVRMIPELKGSIERLEFVNWVGVYHPAYKIDKDITPGEISVSFRSDVNQKVLSTVQKKLGLYVSSQNLNQENLVLNLGSRKKINELAKMEEVEYITNTEKIELKSEMGSQIIGGGAWFFDNDDNASTPYREYGNYGAYVNQIGYTGDGVTIAIADTGLGDGTTGDASHDDFTGRVIGGARWDETLGIWRNSDWQDGYGHGTHVAGLAAGDTYGGNNLTYAGHGPYYLAQGLAYDSSLYIQKVFDNNGNWIGPDLYEMIQNANQNGAYIHSNSWGEDDGDSLNIYDSRDVDFDKAVRDANSILNGNQPMVIVVSAGNEGGSGIASPGNGKNVITVGASETYMPDASDYNGISSYNPNNVRSFSSKGWTEDNRVKPTIVAPGHVCLSTSSPSTSSAFNMGLYSEDSSYEWASGTSQSTPTVSGAASVIVDYYKDRYGVRPSPAMVKALLVNTAIDLSNSEGNTGPIPNKQEGWGLANLPKICDPPVNVINLDQNSKLKTGQEDEFYVSCNDTSHPMKISLTWTDKNASAGDNITLRNNLNLQVIAPDGSTEYYGNAFDIDGDSISDSNYTFPNTKTMSDFNDEGGYFDDRNVVENVFIRPSELQDGLYKIKVIGENIPADGTNSGNPSQDYALTIYNAETTNSSGRILLDRDSYTVEDTVNISVVDEDLEGKTDIDITIKSDTEPNGENVTLYPTGIRSQFDGSITISENNSDGILQVSKGDIITAIYYDNKTENLTSENKTDTAKVDADPPTISDLTEQIKLASILTFNTNEEAQAKIFYGLDPPLDKEVSLVEYKINHTFLLDEMTPGLTYHYKIQLKDMAGNKIVYDNDGELYSFTLSPTDNVELGNIGWDPTSNWSVTENNAYSGTKSWKCGSPRYGNDWEETLVSPTIKANNWDRASLTWVHNYSFEDRYDGGVVEINTGGTWERLTPEGGYDALIESSTVLDGQTAFTGESSGWTSDTVDLTSYLDSEYIKIRFRFVSNGAVNYTGWNIDDITINGTIKPEPSFSFTPDNPTSLTNIHFNDNSTDLDGNIVNWTWEFGDDNVSYEKNPTYRYGKQGQYLVILTVKDNFGSTNSTSKLLNISNAKPIIEFSISSYNISTLTTVNFTDGSYDVDGDIVNWTWDFDNGLQSYSQNTSVSFEDDGVYNINLTVRDDDGASNSTSKELIVENREPIAEFEYKPSSPTTQDTVTLSDKSHDLDGSIVNWTWELDGVLLSKEDSIEHIFEDDGEYNITLTVIDDDGDSHSITKMISVENIAPSSNFSFSPSDGIVGQEIQFKDNSSDIDGSIVNWTWELDDKVISYEQDPKHTFSQPGKYTVRLTVIDNDGGTSQIEKEIKIDERPIPRLMIIVISSIILLFVALFIYDWYRKNYYKNR